MLLPVLPLYLINTFNTPKSEIGLVLAGYTVAALVIRPISGFILDMFNRKPVYLLSYILFVFLFVGYPLAQSILLFGLLRVFHGIAFGIVTTAGNTLIIDIMPASRRGEGLGYFGISNNLAMAMGPMIGLMLHEFFDSWNLIFYTSVASGLLGFIFAINIKTSIKAKYIREPFLFDRFFLLKGWKSGLSLLFLAIPFGMTTTYLALYAEEVGATGNMGLFFSIMAAGLIVSRTFAGTLVDKGKVILVIKTGILILIAAFFIFSLVGFYHDNLGVLVQTVFFGVALFMGVGYGMLFPAYNTLFIDLAPHNRRATASSTYLTSWDVGIGFGLVFGGNLGEYLGFTFAFFISALLVVLSFLVFTLFAAPHFQRNKLR